MSGIAIPAAAWCEIGFGGDGAKMNEYNVLAHVPSRAGVLASELL